MVSCHISKDFTYLDGASSDVTVVGKSSGEGRPIVESVGFLAFSHFHLFLEGLDLVPVAENVFFFLREVGSLGDC
jgi:hypothetical protein